jgi:uncharacterized protein (TIGR02646 family)
MIRLPAVSLQTAVAARLAAFQAGIDSSRSYAEAVAEAKRLFGLRNTRQNKTFQAVRAALATMCSGARRCCYCEDSCADEVEHIKPKDLYPHLVFTWENYVYACGPCNGPKNNKFRIFHPRAGTVLDISRKVGDPVRKPPHGDPLLINPRHEDPLGFLELEMDRTFYLLPRLGLRRRDRQRAEYTIELLHLNDRDLLPRARRNAFGSFRARLVEYERKKRQGVAATILQNLVKDLLQSPHPTVWAEMKRQRNDYVELDGLFRDVPEALNW